MGLLSRFLRGMNEDGVAEWRLLVWFRTASFFRLNG